MKEFTFFRKKKQECNQTTAQSNVFNGNTAAYAKVMITELTV